MAITFPNTFGGLSGAIPLSYLDANFTAINSAIGTSAGNLVALNGSAKLPAVDGSLLTNLPSAGAGVGGSTRKGIMSITSASATGTYTADEVVVETALAGNQKLLGTYSQALNLATTGAGGMDTGSAPTSGFVSIYAIYNPTTPATSIMACNVTTSSGSVYGGANFPSGYTYSSLLGIVPTNGSSQMKPGLLIDRKWFYQAPVSIFTGTSGGGGSSTLTSQSISAGVPAAARYADILFFTTTNGFTAPAVGSDATGTGAEVRFGSNTGATKLTYFSSGANGVQSFKDIPIITSQTIYWAEYNGQTNDCMSVAAYGF